MTSPQLYPEGFLETGTFDREECTNQVVYDVLSRFVEMGYYPTVEELWRVVLEHLSRRCLGGDFDEAVRMLQSNKFIFRLQQEWLRKQQKTWESPRKGWVPRSVKMREKDTKNKEFQESMNDLLKMLGGVEVTTRQDREDEELADLMSGDDFDDGDGFEDELEGVLSGDDFGDYDKFEALLSGNNFEEGNDTDTTVDEMELFDPMTPVGWRVGSEGFCAG